MNKIIWLCVLGLVIATLLPVSQQTADEAGLEDDISQNVHDLTSRIKRHGDGTFTSDLSAAYEEELIQQMLKDIMDGKYRASQNPGRIPY